MHNSLQIFSIINKNFADTLEDADLVFPIAENAIKQKTHLDLSFEGLDICSTIFLNNFLGKLYLSFGNTVDEYISFTGFDHDNTVIPNKIERLKKRALNHDEYHEIYNNAIGNA